MTFQLKNLSSNLVDYCSSMNSQGIIVYYKGPFDDKILAEIGAKLRNKTFDSPKTGKKLFSIFIELAQNISLYSSEVNQLDEAGERKWGVGTVVIQEHSNSYTLTTGNLVKKEVLTKIVEKCEEINMQDQDGLRAMKRKYRSSPENPDHKGGNIGLIQVALKSDLPLIVEEKEVDDTHSFFSLSVNINKVINNQQA